MAGEGHPVTVVVPAEFGSAREAARFVDAAVRRALDDLGHVTDPVIWYDGEDGRSVRLAPQT